MSKNTAYQGQCFLDKVLELTGDIENSFAMSLLNEVAITDDLVLGKEVKASAPSKKKIVAFFDEYNRPATNFNAIQQESISNNGIGYMIIGKNFIIG